MHTAWLKGLTKDQKEKRKKFLLANQEVLDLLAEVLENDFQEYEPDYQNPSWAYEQADVNGHNRAIRRVLNLISLTKD
jgi:hypothetical protein